MAINLYVNFDGNCREAVEFYSDVFKTEKPEILTYGDNPPDPNFALPEDTKNLVMHTRLNIKGTTIMFSDVFPGMPFTIGNNITIAVVDKDMDFIKDTFDRLKEDGMVGMELQETFWTKCYGSLTDKFGIAWQFNHDGEVN